MSSTIVLFMCEMEMANPFMHRFCLRTNEITACITYRPVWQSSQSWFSAESSAAAKQFKKVILSEMNEDAGSWKKADSSDYVKWFSLVILRVYYIC